ncbi:uncharacterized protein LOC142986768 isoform X2 [Anticarsia gemmatalis]|uniref:uncharacterized protein LOC142986768 isoform X2 n=1 Tax=Anticarsia gemmatalis TaxID=129554 RepID=UPI003F762A71
MVTVLDKLTSDIPDDEIERMLDANLPEDFRRPPKCKEKTFVTKEKVVLEEKGVNQFEILPLDWIVLRHGSGMPVYMHRTTRVCTVSRPYFLGKSNARRHDIPISAIPCLAYKTALEEEERQRARDLKIAEQIRNSTSGQSEDIEQNELNIKQEVNEPEQEAHNEGFNFEVPIIGQIKSEPASSTEAPEPTNNGSSLETMETGIGTPKRSSKTTTPTCPMRNLDVPNSEQLAGRATSGADLSVIRSEANLNEAVQHTNEASVGENTDTSHQINKSGGKKQVSFSRDVVDGPSKKKICRGSKRNKHHYKKVRKLVAEMISKNQDGMSQALAASSHGRDGTSPACPVLNKGIGRPTPSCTVTSNSIQMATSPQRKDGSCADGAIAGPSTAPDAIEIEVKPKLEEVPLNMQPVVLPGGLLMHPPRVETISTDWRNVTPEKVNEYCRNLFQFKTLNVMHFKRWADRRKFSKTRKMLQYPTLPEGTKLITIPATATPEIGGKTTKRDWVMNMNDRSYLSVFHEYVRRTLQKQPVYQFKQVENATHPYQATVFIRGMQYGVGYGSSKRQAKSAAARASIQILIPEMKEAIERAEPPVPKETNNESYEFFDQVSIDDPRVPEFCVSSCEPSPHAILRTCLLRNFGSGDRHTTVELKQLDYQKVELTMTVGKHSVVAMGKNKKAAKQRASQCILQLLHPHIRFWGSLLRLYGTKSVKSFKEKKVEEQEITMLQDKARRNQPNYAVLAKLRAEMRKLRERDEKLAPIGTMVVKESLPTHSGSNLNNLEL